VIRGIGNDIIEIERIKRALKKNDRFLTKLFTLEERHLFQTRKDLATAVAGRFAAKEAVVKALGTGFRQFGMADVEILRDELGKPVVKLSQKVKDTLELSEALEVLVTISHSKEYAVATALALEEESP
jgi:holo-[acyl-carrier protein] synthase